MFYLPFANIKKIICCPWKNSNEGSIKSHSILSTDKNMTWRYRIHYQSDKQDKFYKLYQLFQSIIYIGSIHINIFSYSGVNNELGVRKKEK